MPKPRLPHRAEETWEGGFVLDRAQPVIDVSGGGGLVLAGGAGLLMLRPGAQAWKGRALIEGLGAVIAVAAEQGPPWRYAVAWEKGITLFGLPKDQTLTLTAEETETQVTHMVWARHREERALYLRWNDGSVGRLRLDLGTVEHFHVLPMDAIASDAAGVLAMVATRCAPKDAHAIFTEDGVRLEERPAVAAPGYDGGPPAAGADVTTDRVHVAVAGAAIAYAVEGWGAHVSRGVDDDFVPCSALLGGGPLAFQGESPGSALFGACLDRSTCVIHRVEAGGAVQRIIELEGEGGGPPSFSALLWDQTRRVLWSASPQAGLLKSEEPTGKGGKKVSLS